MEDRNTYILCPDCELGHIAPGGNCGNCHLSDEDLEAAAEFFGNLPQRNL